MKREDDDAGTGSLDSLKSVRGQSAGPLGPNSEIGRKLRQYYDDLVRDEVPDRFTQLLNQLEKVEAGQGKE